MHLGDAPHHLVLHQQLDQRGVCRLQPPCRSHWEIMPHKNSTLLDRVQQWDRELYMADFEHQNLRFTLMCYLSSFAE